jgi:hypothetical protein
MASSSFWSLNARLLDVCVNCLGSTKTQSQNEYEKVIVGKLGKLARLFESAAVTLHKVSVACFVWHANVSNAYLIWMVGESCNTVTKLVLRLPNAVIETAVLNCCLYGLGSEMLEALLNSLNTASCKTRLSILNITVSIKWPFLLNSQSPKLQSQHRFWAIRLVHKNFAQLIHIKMENQSIILPEHQDSYEEKNLEKL